MPVSGAGEIWVRTPSARLVFESSRLLRHQHTEESGFSGPSMVATSPNRASVAGRTTMLMPARLRPAPTREARPAVQLICPVAGFRRTSSPVLLLPGCSSARIRVTT
jgi:hypothetical protein